MVHYFQESVAGGVSQAALFTGGKKRAKMEVRKILKMIKKTLSE